MPRPVEHPHLPRNRTPTSLSLAAKILAPEDAEDIVGTWLTTPFKGGVHARRLEQIAALEEESART